MLAGSTDGCGDVGASNASPQQATNQIHVWVDISIDQGGVTVSSSSETSSGGGGNSNSKTGPLSSLLMSVSAACCFSRCSWWADIIVGLGLIMQRLWPWPCACGFFDTALRGVRCGLTKGVTLRQPCLRPEGSKSLTAYDGPRACAP